MSFLRPWRTMDNTTPIDSEKVSTRRSALRDRARSRKAEKTNHLDQGLESLRERLGTTDGAPSRQHASRVKVDPTATLARSVYYSPDLDGPAEPGEVVWVTVPSDPPEERPMLVVGRNSLHIHGLLISTGTKAFGDNFLEIGSGEWQNAPGRCWLRLDKTLTVPETDVRRRGVLFPRLRFDVVANRLRSRFHWA
ncbi:hypothetical protein QP027_08380 [Corynebacterium breve]|uniref:Type II toxin-antitoxin system PemK/MazF family toxin n=1 Tax=Corynebacterium breve TaxID=3049799 RepID=A0ABY8VCC5_9CORY|nr:type II toxin-antitoxin system PemK/MazF family toxin [Corynebacterium breve]WIM67138.1 hypothetical protein QP027_08380 [Corynebacterium breve]